MSCIKGAAIYQLQVTFLLCQCRFHVVRALNFFRKARNGFLKKYIYFLAVSGFSCGMRDLSLRCAGSSLQCVSFSLVVAHGLSSCSTQAPEREGSVAVACRLPSCGARTLERMGLVARRHVGS